MTKIELAADFRALLDATCIPIEEGSAWETRDGKKVLLQDDTWVVTMTYDGTQEMGVIGADDLHTDLVTVYTNDWFGERKLFDIGVHDGQL